MPAVCCQQSTNRHLSYLTSVPALLSALFLFSPTFQSNAMRRNEDLLTHFPVCMTSHRSEAGYTPQFRDRAQSALSQLRKVETDTTMKHFTYTFARRACFPSFYASTPPFSLPFSLLSPSLLPPFSLPSPPFFLLPPSLSQSYVALNADRITCVRVQRASPVSTPSRPRAPTSRVCS